MIARRLRWAVLAGGLLLMGQPLWGTEISVEGAPTDTGFNLGALANIRATLRGVTGDAKRYAVFAEIQYYGTTSTTSVQMNQLPQTRAGVAEYEVDWPIPPQAPSGLYTLALRVEDRTEHRPTAVQKVRSFVVYKKLVRISRATIDKTFYSLGEPIDCEVALENLSDRDLKDLRVEFSNANYPWISLFSKEGHENPDLAVKVLREHLDIPAGGAATIPMMPAGTATFLQGQQHEVMGSGLPVRNEKIPPPEVDMYTVAVWNAGRTVLYDMQFTSPAIVRTWDRDLPKPYSRNFTHPYNSDIDLPEIPGVPLAGRDFTGDYRGPLAHALSPGRHRQDRGHLEKSRGGSVEPSGTAGANPGFGGQGTSRRDARLRDRPRTRQDTGPGRGRVGGSCHPRARNLSGGACSGGSGRKGTGAHQHGDRAERLACLAAGCLPARG